jgi:folate-binding protein YgfZ
MNLEQVIEQACREYRIAEARGGDEKNAHAGIRLPCLRPPQTRWLAAEGKAGHIPCMSKIAALPARAVLALAGSDRVGFLNGLVSNDVAAAAPGHAVWAALLTAQGKFLADFFIFAEPDRLLLDCEASQAAMLSQRLMRYKLRADVAMSLTDLGVYAAWDGQPAAPEAIVASDPRLPDAGWRLLSEHPLTTTASTEAWDLHRLSLGLPDGTRDMESEKTVLLEAGFDELHGVSWTKGCYMGQELTARTRYRGLVKRRLLPVRGSEALPPPGTPVFADGREVGQMRSSRDTLGLASLRLDAMGAADLRANDVSLRLSVPSWAKLPEPA